MYKRHNFFNTHSLIIDASGAQHWKRYHDQIPDIHMLCITIQHKTIDAADSVLSIESALQMYWIIQKFSLSFDLKCDGNKIITLITSLYDNPNVHEWNISSILFVYWVYSLIP